MPILGNNTKASSSFGAAGSSRVAKYNLASASVLNELHGWFNGGPGEHWILCIYADSAGLPGALLAYTAPLNAAAGDNELSQSGFSVSLPAGDYWLGWTLDTGSAQKYYYTTGVAGQCRIKASGATFNPPANPFGTPTSSDTAALSVWAVVTTTPTTTVGRFSRLKLKPPLVGTNVGGGVLEIDVGYPSYAALKAGVTSYADILA